MEIKRPIVIELNEKEKTALEIVRNLMIDLEENDISCENFKCCIGCPLNINQTCAELKVFMETGEDN